MEHYLSKNNQSTKEVSWRRGTKFRQEKSLQSENNLLNVGARTQWIKWKCPPKVSLRDEWLVTSGEKSVELEIQKQRVKSVAEQVYVHPCAIPPNPSITSDLCDQTRDDNNIFHVPLIQEEELEEGEILEECSSCTCSKPDAKESSSSIPGIDPAVVATISAFARSVQSDLIDPDFLTVFLCNPQLVDQLMQGKATRISSSTGWLDEHLYPLPRTEHSSSKKEQLKMLVNEYGTQESVGSSSSTKINRVVSSCKFFNSSKGCWNGSNCRFQHDVEAHNAKRRKP